MTALSITNIEFVEYLTKLAAQGETFIIVRQKPVMVDGNQAMHNDGTLKYSWPAFLPERYKPTGAWYGNTGSFIIDRFQDGKISASAANCEFVLVMVLDDIGTKSKIPTIEPTWIMETSPDNYQWGYVFDCEAAPTKGEFTAAIKAIADAGFTDGGAINAVRNFRLPGSVNLKPGKEHFASKLIEFHPEREFTLDQICDALGVNPEEADTASVRSIHLKDDGDDDILQWIDDNGMLLENANQSGWYGVVCPNSNEHSDGNPMGRYHPVNRAYCCYHEHCAGFGSREYLAWAFENGAAKHEPGVRPELLTNAFVKALEKITPSKMFELTPEKMLAEVERKELGRIEKEEWYDRFAYIQSDDSYYDLVERNDIGRGTFNAIYRHISCKSIHTGRRVEASVSYDENRQAHAAKILTGLTYAAGDTALVWKSGELFGNRWTDGRPAITSKSGNISPWINHCEHLVPNESERNHVWDMMAFKLQNPTTKINHAVLHVGDEGCGKDLMWMPFIWSVCGSDSKNLSIVDSDKLQSNFTYHLEAEVLVLNELKEPDSAARRALANKLKPIIAAPPDMLDINRKGKDPYKMANRLFVLAFSNEQIPISLSSQDRRWFCINSEAQPMERIKPGSGLALYNWYRQGNFEHIGAWLHSRDVSKFNPGAAPAMTEFKLNLLESGMSSLESTIVEMIRHRAGEFARGAIGSPFHHVCDRIADLTGLGRSKVPQSALLHALKEAGWIDCGRIASADQPNKKRIFADPEVAKTHSKSELRRMIEAPPEPKAVVLDIKRSA